jgi:hypothetical protein
MGRVICIAAPFVCISGEWVLPVATSEAKVGENWGLDYYFFIPVIPSTSIIERHRLWRVWHRRGGGDHVGFSRRGGAEMGIPTIIGKENRGHVAGQGRDHYDSERQLALRRGGHAANITPAWECPNQKIVLERPSASGCWSVIRAVVGLVSLCIVVIIIRLVGNSESFTPLECLLSRRPWTWQMRRK